jgi:endonuclease/exonuclease/phosphatase family metal-dependent hydrolase
MPTINFIYWNTNKKGLTQEPVLENIFSRRGTPDILLLGECPSGLMPTFLSQHGLTELPVLSKDGEALQQRIYYNASKLTLTLVLPVKTIKQTQSTPLSRHPFGNSYVEIVRRLRVRITRLVQMKLTVNDKDYLLASVHFPSKIEQDEMSQLQIARSYKAKLLDTVAKNEVLFDNRIIVVGDFNMNPFDAGMVEPLGFHALGNRDMANPKTQRHYDVTPIFYNPCWALLGDYYPSHADRRTGGSIYYEGSSSRRLFWHLFDQVIVSREIINLFEASSLALLEVRELHDEMMSGIKRKDAEYSDHFPLTFSLTL